MQQQHHCTLEDVGIGVLQRRTVCHFGSESPTGRSAASPGQVHYQRLGALRQLCVKNSSPPNIRRSVIDLLVLRSDKLLPNPIPEDDISGSAVFLSLRVQQ